jgi:hypothetical protein
MAPLAPVIDTLDVVPEALRQFYEPKDGKFALSLNGTPPGFVPAADLTVERTKVVEFRDNNIALTKKNAELETGLKKFEGLDADAAKSALAQVEEFKKKGAGKPDDISALVTSAVEAAVKPLKDELQSTKAQSVQDRIRADENTLRSVVSERFMKAGGLPKALDYIVSQAKDTFTVTEGKVVAQPNKYSTANPGNLIDLDEWLSTASREHDFAFKPSQGGGAPPAGGGAPTHRAGQRVIKNPTAQQLGDPSIAKELREGKVRFEYDNAGSVTQ